MSKAIRRAAVVAILAAMLTSVTAFAAPKPDLVLAIGGEPDTGYDPLLGWGRYGHPLFQSTLLTRDADFVAQPDLATAWTLSDDRLIWTIKLRTDAKFSDGTALTAADVAFTFTEGAKAGGALDLTVLDSATAVDNATIQIKLKQPWITFTENFFALGIVPAASYGEGYARNPIGSGPYKLVAWTQGEQLIVEVNPNYYGAKAAFEKITFLFTDEDTSLAAAQAGQVDMVAVPAAGWVTGSDGIRIKNGIRAAFPINYPASDSTRQALAATLAELLKPLGIQATAAGKSWDDIDRVMHSEPVMFGWGSHTPLEVYSLYDTALGGVDYYNAGYFSNAAVDAHFAAAQAAESLEASYPDWQLAEWDGTTGFGPEGDAGWAWLVNLDHIYYVNRCLDIGPTQTEPHGHGWPITALIQNWKWTCE
ncbi:ABC transporter substrate-binding protein [Devosia psychrophila]|uniref:Extracellular solute-binding protein, family 5 Middle n=1 Tax=Devosia psychrophila TaxID=728005 RepID=A0A0F5PX57_9HYPH|nr:ABC transporter substrate-binding protein [Devosia psychrophila]KKC33247.1 nickel ABC transporter substrate-binding protein [Devosia psychrophila]SFC25603.1 extracellular solute-binding protein, family 5 Middle [Devosia psychrophila]